jgi:hypothetical protein
LAVTVFAVLGTIFEIYVFQLKVPSYQTEMDEKPDRKHRFNLTVINKDQQWTKIIECRNADLKRPDNL